MEDSAAKQTPAITARHPHSSPPLQSVRTLLPTSAPVASPAFSPTPATTPDSTRSGAVDGRSSSSPPPKQPVPPTMSPRPQPPQLPGEPHQQTPQKQPQPRQSLVSPLRGSRPWSGSGPSSLDSARDATELTEARKLGTDARSKKGQGSPAEQLGQNRAESELSDPDDRSKRPASEAIDRSRDEIIVGAHHKNHESAAQSPGPRRQDDVMAELVEQTVAPHYPKRKRISIFNDLCQRELDIPETLADNRVPLGSSRGKGNVAKTMGELKGVLLGYWRGSTAPTEKDKHAVIGFIDARDRLRTRIKPTNRSGEPVVPDYPIPTGPGAGWVSFERIVFCKHLVGLDQYQVKEYVKVRSETSRKAEGSGKISDEACVEEAIRRVHKTPNVENPATQPLIAYGRDVPEREFPAQEKPLIPHPKRRRTSADGSAVDSGAASVAQDSDVGSLQTPGSSIGLTTIDPLRGTRPTRILLGYWRGSSEEDELNRHAVYGILGQNDMFRVKVVRETRDGRFVDGNFPLGAGALWIPYEEVEFEEHIRSLNRSEIKEYCRIRQYQLDHGEILDERAENETRAMREAKARCSGGKLGHQTPAAVPSKLIRTDASLPDELRGRPASGGPEFRQLRRIESRAEARPPRHSLPDQPERSRDRYSSSGVRDRYSSFGAQERTTALAQREISRAEAAQRRADRNMANREMAAAAASEAAASAAAAMVADPNASSVNGKTPFHASENMQRLNRLWARQECARTRNGSEDFKMYDGIKYQRKASGPFMGKLVSQPHILNIDGEDYVEYRVLTKPAFF